MKAINNYLVVENIKEGLKKVGGLLLTEELDSDNRYLKAKIISTGNLVEGLQDGVAFELYWAEFHHDDIVRRTVGKKIESTDK